MKEEHGNFERLVVGHVLGDLPDVDASRFRSHLLGCRDCRARVAELRGIAADLADAERDELARARVRTEAPRRVDHPDEPHPRDGQRLTVRHVTAAAVVVVVLAAAMAFWNLHLRATSANSLAIAQDQGATLEALANGLPLELELASGISGIAVADGERVALSLTGVPTPAENEVLVAWFLGGSDGPAPFAVAPAGQPLDGNLAVTIEDPGASDLVITRETRPAEEPAGPELLRTGLLGS
jgi:hypothetical protein